MKSIFLLVALAPVLSLASVGQMKVLFLGNSHTYVNNVPQLVRSLALTASRPLDIAVDSVTGGHLEDLAKRPDVLDKVRTGGFDVVVLQAAMVSQSHKYDYPQDGAILIAKAAVRAKAKVLMYPEWSRRDIPETEYTEKVYRGIAQTVGGRTAPVGRVWDNVVGRHPWPLWSPDGNHASLSGSFLAANVLYRWLVDDDKPVTTFRPAGVSRGEADVFQALALHAYREAKKSQFLPAK